MNLTDWQIFLLSALPVIELRGPLPVAIIQGTPVFKAYALAVAGNLLPIFPLLLWLEPFATWLRRFPFLEHLFKKILARTRQKGQRVKRFKTVGLMLFVALPLPGTGAWTGAILSWLVGLPVVASAVAISCGVVLAGLFVVLASLGAIQMAYVYDFEYLLATIVAIALLYVWYRNRKRH